MSESVLNDMLCGFRIIENPMLTVAGEPYTVKRTWKERLFSKPWRPTRATKTIVPQVPSREVVQYGRTLIMHPVLKKELLVKLDASAT